MVLTRGDPTNSESLLLAYDTVSQRFAGEPRVAIHRLFSEDAVLLFGNCSFDWVYLDADHTLESVRRDIHLWWPKVKIGGFLCGHDYIEERWEKSYSYIQVKEAVDQFCVESGLELYVLTDEKYGSWTIRRDR